MVFLHLAEDYIDVIYVRKLRFCWSIFAQQDNLCFSAALNCDNITFVLLFVKTIVAFDRYIGVWWFDIFQQLDELGSLYFWWIGKWFPQIFPR